MWYCVAIVCAFIIEAGLSSIADAIKKLADAIKYKKNNWID